jgi:hypothetical protein
MTARLPAIRPAHRVVELRRAERIRYERMIQCLRVLSWVAFGAALIGVLLPDPAGVAASATAVTVVVAAPLIRVAWLAIRWYRRGDRRYAAVSAGLLLIIALGSVLALVTR